MARCHEAVVLAFAFCAAATPVMAEAPLVPGGCTEPAESNRGRPGCYLTAEIDIGDPPAEVYWHVIAFAAEADAHSEAARHKHSLVAQSHGRIWLHVVGGPRVEKKHGEEVAVVGPLPTPDGAVLARFLESDFPPGMRTRVHSHPGPEAFYVVSGEQCMESPAGMSVIGAGNTYVVPAGAPHVQASRSGRKSLVLVLRGKDRSWMTVESGWSPSGACWD